MKIILSKDGVKREIETPFAMCIDREDLGDLIRSLRELHAAMTKMGAPIATSQGRPAASTLSPDIQTVRHMNRETEAVSIQQHPAYHQGFYDAQFGEPIFNDCPSPEYRAGWNAFWSCRSILARSESFCGETDCTYQDGWCKCGLNG